MTVTENNGPFKPVRMLDVELSEPLPVIPNLDPVSHQSYGQAWILVRLHTKPVGLVMVSLAAGDLQPEDYVGVIWGQLQKEINEHLLQDGLPSATALEEAALAVSSVPACLHDREEFLERAPFASVIICTRDRPDQLAVALSSVSQMQYPRFEILVIDNASKTGSTRQLIDSRFGHTNNLRYFREDRPGVSWARNCGLRHAKGEFVAFTDDDVIVDKYWLADLMKGFEVASDVACVTGLTLPAEIETQAQMWFEEMGGFTFGFDKVIHNIVTAPLPHRLYPFSAIKFGAGVNIAFRASLLRAVNGFDPAFPNGQDIEAYYRVMKSGHTLVYEPSALVRHFHRRDYAALQRQLHNYGIAFTAFLTKCLVSDPAGAISLIRKLPYGLYATLSPKAPRFSKKRPDFPEELTRLERKGLATGPFMYFRNRRRARQVARRFGLPEPCCSEDGLHSPPAFS
ncbi:MAG: glycosyltransferase [Chloroflexi bacterium]|nr:glycosyltransferase [Chloroflexota bacterium]